MAGEGVDNVFSQFEPENASYFPDVIAPPPKSPLRQMASERTLRTITTRTSIEDGSVRHDGISINDGKSEIHSPRRARFCSSSSITIAADPVPPVSRHLSRLTGTYSHFSDSSQSNSNDEEEKAETQGCDDGCLGSGSDLVDWDGPNDPENPQNWSRGYKWFLTITLGIVTFVITFASSIFSTATKATARQFGVSNEVMILGTSLFVLGFAVGPIIWGPMSELYGRKYPLFIGFFMFALLQIPVAVAQNIQTIMICRFFGGVFGSAPLGTVGGQLTDLWGPLDRGVAMTFFIGAVFMGPVVGPIVGGFIVQSHLGWRWTEFITAVMGATFGVIGFFTVPETFAPILLSRRATKIRFATRNWAVHAKYDQQQIDLRSIMEKYLLRPFAMLFKEPILALMTLYMSIIYGIIYLVLEAYPIAFQEQRGWNNGVGALPFLSISMGVIIGVGIIIYTTKTHFTRKFKENNGVVVPEDRLIPMIIGGFLFPVGMFVFAWTSSPDVTWVPQVISGVLIGAGMLMIFLQGLNYIIDCYVTYANSAMAANTFLRSGFGAGFSLFATSMYHKLGVNWAASLLAFVTAALFPVPILFFFYGHKIRKMSKYSPT